MNLITKDTIENIRRVHDMFPYRIDGIGRVVYFYRLYVFTKRWWLFTRKKTIGKCWALTSAEAKLLVAKDRQFKGRQVFVEAVKQ